MSSLHKSFKLVSFFYIYKSNNKIAVAYVSLVIVWTVRILLSVMSLGMQYFLVAHVHLLGSMLSSAVVDTIRH